MLEATTSITTNSVPTFGQKRDTVQMLDRTTELLKSTNNLKNLDEDTLDKVKDYIEQVQVNPESKVQGPLKSLALSLVALATGTMVTKGSATKLFYMVKDKNVVQNLFTKMGKSFGKLTENLAQKAQLNETAGAARKYFFKGLDYLAKKASAFAEKGITAVKGTEEFATKTAEKLTKNAVELIGSGVGLATTGAALSVDKNGNGKSDMFEGKDFTEEKKTRKAILDLAEAVIDSAA